MTAIIDGHHHIWQLADLSWLQGPSQPRIFGEYDAIKRDYLAEEFMADLAGTGVEKSVFVQANRAPGQEINEVAWVQEVADVCGFPHAIVGYADFSNENSEETLKAYRGFANVRGIRQQLHWHENPQYRFASTPDAMLDAGFQRNFAKLADFGWLFELQVFTDQMADAAKFAAAFPGTVFVLEHAGMLEDTSEQGRVRWREGLKRLAALPNMHTKLSALGTFVRCVDRQLIADIVGETAAIFGAERCLWGSNFPIEKIWTNYRSVLDAHLAAIEGLSDDDQHHILYGTAARLYDLS
jgi:predicted TIM-barrel fold metal-dependent hydrolase